MSILLKSRLGDYIVDYIKTYSRSKNKKDYSHQIYIILPNLLCYLGIPNSKLEGGLDIILLREALDKIENRIRIPILFKNIGLSGYSLLLAKWENNQYIVFHFSNKLDSSPQLMLVEYTKTPESIHIFKIINSNSIYDKGLAIFNMNSYFYDKISVHWNSVKDMNPEEKQRWNGLVLSITEIFKIFTSKYFLNQIAIPFVRIPYRLNPLSIIK